MSNRTCAFCEKDISDRHGGAKYCSGACREAGKYRRRNRVPCAECGSPTGYLVHQSPAKPPICHGCRRPGGSAFKHGTVNGYHRHGCRCQPCTDAKTASHRKYREKRSSEGNPVEYRRATVSVACATCGDLLDARLDGGIRRFCSRACVGKSRWASDKPRRQHRRNDNYCSRDTRLAIYRAANWRCQICGEAMSRSFAHDDPWSPTLDHIVPRSLGGSDDPDNLRAAHFWCNSVRGDESFYTDADLQAA